MARDVANIYAGIVSRIIGSSGASIIGNNLKANVDRTRCFRCCPQGIKLLEVYLSSHV